MIHGLTVEHLTDRVIQRSKRMILDTLGVGFLGTNTEVFHKASEYSKVRSSVSTVERKPSVHISLLMTYTHQRAQRCVLMFYHSTLHFRYFLVCIVWLYMALCFSMLYLSEF